MMRGMVIDMNDEQLHTLAELQAFLDGTVTVAFAVATEARYAFIARIVRRFGYGRLKRPEKAVVLRFLEPRGRNRRYRNIGHAAAALAFGPRHRRLDRSVDSAIISR